MTKRVISFLVIVAIMFVLPASVPVKTFEAENGIEAVEQPSDKVADGIMTARFENMLNHNYIYGEDFYSDRAMIENAILALLDYSVEGEIEQQLVLQFIANMYGREVSPDAATYDFLPASEGKFAIIPRGYSEYLHEIVSVDELVAGYKVVSNMTINPHDSVSETVIVETIFVPNESSNFGYNIVSSVITGQASDSVM